MNNQTLENNQNNRGQTSKTDLENEIRSTWLGIVNMFQDKAICFIEFASGDL